LSVEEWNETGGLRVLARSVRCPGRGQGRTPVRTERSGMSEK